MSLVKVRTALSWDTSTRAIGWDSSFDRRKIAIGWPSESNWRHKTWASLRRVSHRINYRTIPGTQKALPFALWIQVRNWSIWLNRAKEMRDFDWWTKRSGRKWKRLRKNKKVSQFLKFSQQESIDFKNFSLISIRNQEAIRGDLWEWTSEHTLFRSGWVQRGSIEEVRWCD